ncbi:MAG: class I SAM-dependent methyltransferase [Holophagales bacterium]|jgi:hypothetical protein|nr:class I SAM-dependent methyltransferase [Holophagales bacterium]
MNFEGQSDKAFWHGYVDFYENYFPKSIEGLIVEFGVFMGDSIRWLLERFPNANIIGADIVGQMEQWPTGERIAYRKLDQGSEHDVSTFLKSIDAPELIIEDGSHVPSHQMRCFKHGFAALKSGGMYIIEDINTSLPQHRMFKKSLWKHQRLEKIFRKFQRKAIKPTQTSLTIVLAFEHLLRLGREKLNGADLEMLCKMHDSRSAYFSENELAELYGQVGAIHVYRRATLPKACHRCKSTEFDYNAYRCRCGVEIYDLCDSMTAIVTKK